MYDGPIKNLIKEQMRAMLPELEIMVDHADSSETAVKNVISLISSKVSAMSRGWLSSAYAELSEKALAEDVFQTPANANKFYALELERTIVSAYKLDVNTLNSYKEGISVREVNKIYTTAAAAVGAGAVGGILLGVLSGTIDIPLVVIIAGAVGCALCSGGVTYTKIVPNVNKSRYKEALRKFLAELTGELCLWLDSIADFFNAEIDNLRKTL